VQYDDIGTTHFGLITLGLNKQLWHTIFDGDNDGDYNQQFSM
jgi:hypothetical protein